MIDGYTLSAQCALKPALHSNGLSKNPPDQVLSHVAMRYPCHSKHCGFASDNQRGLTNHQRACDAYKRHEQASLLKRSQEKVARTKVWGNTFSIKLQKLMAYPQPIRMIPAPLPIEVEPQQEPSPHFSFSPSPEPPPPILLLTRAGRPQRHYRLPARYEDIPPEGPAPLPPRSLSPAHTIICRVVLHVRDTLRTGLNRFGLLREYLHRPSYDPVVNPYKRSFEPTGTQCYLSRAA